MYRRKVPVAQTTLNVFKRNSISVMELTSQFQTLVLKTKQ